MTAPVFSTTRLLAAATVSAVAATPALGQVVVDLNFTDGTTANAYGADRFTDPLDGFKPRFIVADDAAGLGSGNALFVESAGGGAEWYIPFSAPITLVAGSTISYSFDVRMDPNSPPASGNDQLYVGIFADADGSLGQTFNAGGVDDVDAVFGSESGHFDYDFAPGLDAPISPDFGMHSRIPVGSDAPIVIRANARMRTENANQTGIMSGSGETVANPFSTLPDEDIAGLDISTTTRHTFTGVWGIDNSGSEPMLTASYTVVDHVAGTTVNMANDDPLSDPDLATFDPTFHYIVFENIGDFDYIIDNIKVELVGGASEIAGDYNDSGLVEQGDLDQVLANWGAGFASVPGTWVNQRPTEGIVDQAELDVVLTEWGSSAAPSFAGSSVPEPATAALIGLGGLALLRRRAA